ncbi:MAG TPA: DNA-processing protein DprA [Candidatus Paceibacterota bacterium]
MPYSIRDLKLEEFPPLLKEIPDPPKKLFLAGSLPKEENKILCIVGSRKYTQYGKEICEKLISEIKGYPITIVSGLALGTDSIAHKAAMKNGLQTVALPGSGLNSKNLYPSSHLPLAEEIIENGGGLLSEFDPDFKATLWSFPQRNRIMAGISHAVLIIEAEIKSGTLITSRLATEYNRDVMTVPGSIFSKNSEGPHMLIKLGATPVTSGEDILKVLNIETSITKNNQSFDISNEMLSEDEKKIVELLHNPVTRDDLIRQSGMPASKINMIITAMEIKGIITESVGEIRIN